MVGNGVNAPRLGVKCDVAAAIGKYQPNYAAVLGSRIRTVAIQNAINSRSAWAGRPARRRKTCGF
jgi:hypothetical protein